MELEQKNGTDGSTTVAIKGRLDTTTAPELEAKLDSVVRSSKGIVLDMKDLQYISSAGLRVLLKTQKAIGGNGGMKLVNVPESVMEVFTITGFSEILDIEG